MILAELVVSAGFAIRNLFDAIDPIPVSDSLVQADPVITLVLSALLKSSENTVVYNEPES